MDTVIDRPQSMACVNNQADNKQDGSRDMVWDETSWELTDFNADFEACLNLNAAFQPQ